MGVKGDKHTDDAALSATLILEKLSSIPSITSKKMFGGYGLFHNSKMFGLIDSKGVGFVKGDKSLKNDYAKMGSIQHSKMPYFSIPDNILQNEESLLNWVNSAIRLSKD